MTTLDFINYMAILVLAGFVVALGYLIVLLHRANRMLGRIENLSKTFRSFVSDIVPAIVNMGTIATALESVLRAVHERTDNGSAKKK
ncbi:MAG: hypothetical protein HZB70_03925 [Candidatus Berkelbacteria bacterium]|nr:MAG: hypothetical protein HZB70_03925 [Candidatus Berkelbacteria bacterium]QQG51552.1 MAG: hypothetical protein HY845_03265 [Candidatus Berkelbacteria bacterium]